MINRRQLHENAVGNPLMKFVRQLRKDVDYLLHNAIVNPERLSDLSEDLGYIQAGAFICGTGSLEDGDFTGNMMIYPPYEDADGDNFTLFGMNNGTLTVGWNSDDGKFYFGGKQGWLDADGLAITATTPGGGLALPNQVKWMVGATAVSGLIAYRDITNDMIPAVWYANGTVDEREASLYAAATNYGSTKVAYIYLYAPASGNSVITLSADSVVLPNDSVSYAEIQNTAAANVVLGQTGVAGDIVEIPCTAAMRGLMDDTTLGAMKATLDLEIGFDVQAWDKQLDDLAACAITADGDFIVGNYGDGSEPVWQKQAKATARTSMGLGTFAVQNVAACPALTMTGTITMAGNRIIMQDSDISMGTTTGGMIGIAAGQKLAFWGATPVIQQAHIANASGGVVIDVEARAAIASINALCATLGLTAAS